MATFLTYASVLILLYAVAQAQPRADIPSDWEQVICGHSTKDCECTGTMARTQGSPDIICYFELNIEQRHTFTRYILDDNMQIPGFGGRVWYFNDQGQFGEYPPEMGQPDTPSCVSNPNCTEAITVDGRSFRALITVNSRFPGPTLIVPNNSIVVVDVYNRLDAESTSIHWHGMHQMNTPWMDGVEHITQCGIAPSSSFRYIFRAFPPGTHWYHSHSGAQRTDGLFGALIVREDNDTLRRVMSRYGSFQDDPTQHTLTLLDWQVKNSLDLFTQIHGGIRFFDQDTPPTNDRRQPRTCSPDGVEVGPVSFWSGLINGRGRHNTIPYNKTRLSTFTVQRNMTYRFRLIGAQSLFAFRFSIDEHNLTLIATDGHFVERVVVDFIIIHSGERYDFLLETNNISSSKTDFIIRAETLEVAGSSPQQCENDDFISTSRLYTNHTAEGILHYGDGNIPMYETIAQDSTPKSMECANRRGCTAVNCPFKQFPAQYRIQCIHVHDLLLLEAVKDSELPSYTTLSNTLFFNFGFEGDGSTSAINGRNFRFPPEPLQLATQTIQECNLNNPILCSSRPAGRWISPDCLCTHVHTINRDQTYRFVFTAVGPNRTSRGNWNFAHPIHLHGHSFHVTRIGFGNYEMSGQIASASRDIDCGNATFCANPTWASDADPDSTVVGETISSKAPLKDTILIPAGGYAVVYFRSNNPGYWFLHCHIEVHQLEGMSVVINEAPGQHNVPPPNMGECGAFNWSVATFMVKERYPSTTMQQPESSPTQQPESSPTQQPEFSPGTKQQTEDFEFQRNALAGGLGSLSFILLLALLITCISFCCLCYKCKQQQEQLIKMKQQAEKREMKHFKD